MSLRVWLPLTNNLGNRGSEHIIFRTVDSNFVKSADGVIGNCYQNNAPSYNTGAILSDEMVSLGSHQSMFCWFKFTTLSSAASLGGCMISQHRYQTCTGMGLTIAYVDTTHGYLSCNTGDGDASRTYNTYRGSTLLQANTWYHGGFTYDGTTIKFYLNGQLDGTHTVPNIAVPADYLTVACWSLATSGHALYHGYDFNGYLNDVRIYDHTLELAEIDEIINKQMLLHYTLSGAPRPLPIEFQELEYIEGAANAWFNTGITFKPETDACKVICKTNDTSHAGMVLASQSSTKYFWIYSYMSNGLRLYADSGAGQELGGGISPDLYKHTAVYKNKQFYIDGTYMGALTKSYTSDDYPLYLFAWGPNAGNYPFNGRVYYADIMQDGEYKRMFLPAKRIDDGAVGMYDLCYNQFYTSTSGVSFTAGPVKSVSTKVADASGFGNDAIVYGAPSLYRHSARYLYCMNFDSNSKYISATSISEKVRTVCFWFKMNTSFDGTSRVMFADWRSKLAFGIYSNALNVICTCANYSLPAFTLDEAFEANRWYHVCIIKNASGSDVQLFIDGNEITERSSTPDYWGHTGDVLVIGERYSGGYTTTCNAMLSDFRMYNYAISEKELYDLRIPAVRITKSGDLHAYTFVERN